MKNIKIIVGDIIKLKVDVIVNAANSVNFLLSDLRCHLQREWLT